MDVIEARRLRFPARAAGPADRRLVLLLHGFPQTSHEWRAQLAALGGAGYRAVAFDQRGYAPTARPAAVEAYRTDELVADTLAVADALSAGAFDVVGHDWGGVVAWHLGGRHADRLRTLTVVSTPHPMVHARALRSGGGRRGCRPTSRCSGRRARPRTCCSPTTPGGCARCSAGRWRPAVPTWS